MLTKGTAKHSEKELAEELETYAIRLGGSADMDSASVSARCLTEHAPRAMKLLAEVVRTPTFPADELEKLRKQTLTSLAISDKEPSTKADREFRRRLFGDHPYGRTATGEAADVKAVTVEDLQDVVATVRPPGPGRAACSPATSPRRRPGKLATEAFGDWNADGPLRGDVQMPAPPPAEPTHIYLVDQPARSRAKSASASAASNGTTAEYPVARVVGDYFGGAFSSRLNEVIRVQKGLTYGARGGFSPARFDGRFDGQHVQQDRIDGRGREGRPGRDRPAAERAADRKGTGRDQGPFRRQRRPAAGDAAAGGQRTLGRRAVRPAGGPFRADAGPGRGRDAGRMRGIWPKKRWTRRSWSWSWSATPSRLKDDLEKIAPVTVVK